MHCFLYYVILYSESISGFIYEDITILSVLLADGKSILLTGCVESPSNKIEIMYLFVL